MNYLISAVCCFQMAAVGYASQRETPISANVATQPGAALSSGAVNMPGARVRATGYVLGPGDQLTLSVTDLDDFTGKTFTIDMGGEVNFPLVGRIHAGGLSAAELEQQLKTRLRRIVKDPDVVISISGSHSQPVSILGAVNSPGVHQLEGEKSLFEVLSLAGGLRQDAGNSVNITRDLRWGRIPLPGAKDDSTGHYNTAFVSVKSIMHASDPSENVTIEPDDVVSVPKGDVVYAVGSVTKPGGFLLGENETLSTLQVLSLAEGLQKTAAPDRAKILRSIPGSTSRTEIAVNIKQLMAGKAPDIPLKSDDILFIPNSAAKSAGYRTMEAMIQAATGVAVYGRF